MGQERPPTHPPPTPPPPAGVRGTFHTRCSNTYPLIWGGGRLEALLAPASSMLCMWRPCLTFSLSRLHLFQLNSQTNLISSGTSLVRLDLDGPGGARALFTAPVWSVPVWSSPVRSGLVWCGVVCSGSSAVTARCTTLIMLSVKDGCKYPDETFRAQQENMRIRRSKPLKTLSESFSVNQRLFLLPPPRLTSVCEINTAALIGGRGGSGGRGGED